MTSNTSHYRVDEVDAASRNLNDLLDVMCEIQFQRDADAKEDPRMNSLLWIARDLSCGIVAKLEEQSAAAMAKHKESRA